MSAPTPDWSAQHRAVALQAASMACERGTNPHALATYADHLCAYISDGTVPPRAGWL
jgi:hypothetical protein